jgi:hypothetical protein
MRQGGCCPSLCGAAVPAAATSSFVQLCLLLSYSPQCSQRSVGLPCLFSPWLPLPPPPASSVLSLLLPPHSAVAALFLSLLLPQFAEILAVLDSPISLSFLLSIDSPTHMAESSYPGRKRRPINLIPCHSHPRPQICSPGRYTVCKGCFGIPS